MNYLQLAHAMQPLFEIKRLRLPYGKAKAIYDLFKSLEQEFAFFREEEAKLIDIYAARNENGTPKIDSAGVITFNKAGDREDYMRDMEKLSTTEIKAFSPVSLSAEDMQGQTVSPETIEKLENIITFK